MRPGRLQTRQGLRWLEEELVDASIVPLPRHALDALFDGVEEVELAPGEVLYRKGAEPAGVWVLRAGAVELFDSSGSRRYVVAVMRTGDMIGDLYLLLGEEPPLNARAVETTQAFFFDAGVFKRAATQHPALCAAWLSNFARRLARSRTRILEVLLRSPEERIARLLVEETVHNHLRLPQKTIADMLGIQRTSVNRVLRQMEAEGLLTRGYGQVRVRDVDGLRAIARGGR